MKTLGKLLSPVWLLMLIGSFVKIELRAATISFTNFNADGVTVSGSGSPVYVQGVGLGIDGGVGPPGEVNRLFQYDAGSLTPSFDSGSELLSISVNGIINSVTINPTLLVCTSGTWAEVTVPFEVIGDFGGPFPLDKLVNPWAGPTTLNIEAIAPPGYPSSLNLEVAGDFGEFMNFLNYRQDNLAEAQDILMGFSVVSMDYTPNVVPEASTGALFGLSLLLLLVGRKALPRRASLRQ